jgi:hypothetical protein
MALSRRSIRSFAISIFLYFEGPDGMVFEYSSGVKMIADELLYRERQLTFDPPGLREWVQNPTFPNFATERENDENHATMLGSTNWDAYR